VDSTNNNLGFTASTPCAVTQIGHVDSVSSREDDADAGLIKALDGVGYD
jgi:hypothetical protein